MLLDQGHHLTIRGASLRMAQTISMQSKALVRSQDEGHVTECACDLAFPPLGASVKDNYEGVHHVGLLCGNITTSVHFYREILGEEK